MKTLTLEKLFERVSLKTSLDQLAQEVAQSFDLDRVLEISPMFAGYDDVNCLLKTNSGAYVVKIFSAEKDLEKITSNVEALLQFAAAGVPVPKLHKTIQEQYVYETQDGTNTYLVVMDYFDGLTFTKTQPTMEDFVNLTEVVSRIHSIPYFNTQAYYDMWLTLYLVPEFDQKKDYLDKSDYELIGPVVEQMRTIDGAQLRKSMVHFDLHRENIMKSKTGEYAVLDLSGCDYNYSVFDFATFIALFCLDFQKPLSENQAVYRQVMSTYGEVGTLNMYEQQIIPLLIKATFASNLLISSFVQKTNSDNNPLQTEYYKSLGKRGLESLKNGLFF